MGSANELVLGGADDTTLTRAATVAIDDVHRIEAKYSRYRDDSVTTHINRAAGGDAVAVDAETAALLGYADACHRESEGRFDITSGVLRSVWDFRSPSPRKPTAAMLAEVLSRIGWAEVEWSATSVRLPRAGMELDFGGIGKEYAADRVATLCIEAGVKHGCVNLGGDVRVWGGRPDGAPWGIGVRHPRDEQSALAGVDLVDGAVATSGDYERYVEIDGRRYCHIIDAQSGEPVSAWQSISVIAPLAIVAGSHATIGMLYADRAPAFFARSGLRWLGVDAEGGVHSALDDDGPGLH
ncbi:MAG: FAD:protein FMN transferase [Proteobacteria bacterium]|nr:FAD:protein FMN transferase [Pseudomonadota bacterium]